MSGVLHTAISLRTWKAYSQTHHLGRTKIGLWYLPTQILVTFVADSRFLRFILECCGQMKITTTRSRTVTIPTLFDLDSTCSR